MAEVSYYSFEYDPDSEPFLADAEGGDHFEIPEGGGDVEQKVLLPTDIQLPSLDTKNTPERWYELLHSGVFFCFRHRCAEFSPHKQGNIHIHHNKSQSLMNTD